MLTRRSFRPPPPPPKHKPDEIDRAAYMICKGTYRSCDCRDLGRRPCDAMRSLSSSLRSYFQDPERRALMTELDAE